jgi:MscS family membrane protein
MTAGGILAAWYTFVTEGKFLGNAVWQWLALFGVLLAALAVGRVVGFLLGRHAERLLAAGRLKMVAMLLRSLERPVALLALAGGLYVAGQFMSLAAAGVQGFWNQVCKTLAVLAAGWFIYRLVDIVELFLRRWTSKTDTLLDDQLVPLIRKTLRVFVVIVLVLFIAQNVFHWDIGALIAGLGIGGLAIALAAKDLLANLFGSVTIFADRPFQMGDRIQIRGYDGMVEEVGFRSTRVRTLTGHLVTIPNAVIANEPVENIARRPTIRRVLNVTVTYDTPPEKVQRGVDILREMLEARREHFPDDYPPRVYFSDYNAASLNIVVYYWFRPPDWWEYLAFNQDFNMELLRRFNAEGIEFAFPTQTLYLKQDSPVSADLRVTGRPPAD